MTNLGCSLCSMTSMNSPLWLYLFTVLWSVGSHNSSGSWNLIFHIFFIFVIFLSYMFWNECSKVWFWLSAHFYHEAKILTFSLHHVFFLIIMGLSFYYPSHGPFCNSSMIFTSFQCSFLLMVKDGSTFGHLFCLMRKTQWIVLSVNAIILCTVSKQWCHCGN